MTKQNRNKTEKTKQNKNPCQTNQINRCLCFWGLIAGIHTGFFFYEYDTQVSMARVVRDKDECERDEDKHEYEYGCLLIVHIQVYDPNINGGPFTASFFRLSST